MRMYKPKGLNVNECYACTRTAVRKCFEGIDLQVLWGAPRSFSFDSRIRRHPEIDGVVIASLMQTIQHTQRQLTLNFYVIDNPLYSEKHRKQFESACLTQMKHWLSDVAISRGTQENMLIAWRENQFFIHRLHFV